jgi:hypothetical protein
MGVLVGVCSALALTLGSGRVRATCTMDLECEGDAICTSGSCTAPPAPIPAVAPTSAPAAGLASAATAERSKPMPPMRRFRSPGLLLGGLTVLIAGGGALFAGLAVSAREGFCSDPECSSGGVGVALMGLGALAVGTGIPLTIVGAKREEVPQTAMATVRPWLGPHGGGLEMKVEL